MDDLPRTLISNASCAFFREIVSASSPALALVRVAMADGVQVIWTPWRDHGELVEVREWLFPASPSDEREDSKLKRKACDQVIYVTTTFSRCVLTLRLQISAWKLRGNLPHAVDSTWLLTESVLTDEIQADLVPVFAVKAAYITAISRYALIRFCWSKSP